VVDVGTGYEQYIYSTDHGMVLIANGHIESWGTCLPCLGFLDKILDEEIRSSIMDISMFFNLCLGYLISAAPALVLWIVVIILATITLKRGGGRAERFLVAGASLEITGNLLLIPTGAIAPWLFHEGYSMTYISSVTSGWQIFLNVINMAGIVCLIYAFWVKFKARKAQLVGSAA